MHDSYSCFAHGSKQMTNIYRVTNTDTGEVKEGIADDFIEDLYTNREAFYYSAKTGSLLGKIYKIEKIKSIKTTRKEEEAVYQTKLNTEIDKLQKEAREKGVSYGYLVAQQYMNRG